MQAPPGVELLGFGRLEPLIMSYSSSDLRDGFHASLHEMTLEMAFMLCLAFMKIASGFHQPSWVREILASEKKQKAGRSEISLCQCCFRWLVASFSGKSLAWQSPWRSHFLRSKPSPSCSVILDPCLVLLQEEGKTLSPYHGHPLNESASPACLSVLHPSNGKG